MFLVLLPIGNETESVRRQPWVSYGLIGVNLLVQLVLSVGFDDERTLRHAGQKYGEIMEFLAGHPYLEPPPDVATHLEPDFREDLASARADLGARGELPDEARWGREQEQLGRLVEEFRERLSRLTARRFGFTPADAHLGNGLTSMFVHGGWGHLIGNLLILLLSGPFLEDVFGRALFGGLYLLSGAAAVVAQAAADPESPIPMVGASGAIAGVMGAFLVRLATSKIRFLFIPVLFLPALRFTFALPAFVILPFWFLEQVASARVGVSGVAWWAHIGGFLCGLAVALAVKLVRLEERVIHPGIEKEISLVQHPGIERAHEARLAGDLATARRAIQEVLAEQPGNPDALGEAYETALAAGDAGAPGRRRRGFWTC